MNKHLLHVLRKMFPVLPDLQPQSYAQRYHEDFLRVSKDDALYTYWVSQRTGLILADFLLPAGYSALEIGCGNGGNFHVLSKASRIEAFDNDEKSVAIARNAETGASISNTLTLNVSVGDAHSFCLTRKYDLIVSLYVLWDRVTVTNEKFREFVTHLAPGGFFYIYTLASENLLYHEAPQKTGMLRYWYSRTRTFRSKLLRQWRLKPSLTEKCEKIQALCHKNGLILVHESRIKEYRDSRINGFYKGEGVGWLWKKPVQEH